MKNLKISILILSMLVFFTSCEKESESAETPITAQEDIEDTSGIQIEQDLPIEHFLDIKRNAGLPTLADIDLDNGNQLHFYGQEEVSGVLVLEEGDCSGCSAISDLHSLTNRELNSFDIFWALSKPGTDIPDLLKKENAKQNNSVSKEQGWARGKLNKNTGDSQAKMATVACNNASFQSSIAGGSFLGGAPNFVRLDKTPNNYSAFKNDCYSPGNGQCWGNPRYKYTSTFTGIKQWKGKICTRNVENNSNRHGINWCGSGCSVDPDCNQVGSCFIYQGPVVYFQYYWNGQWRTMKSGNKTAVYEIPANSTRVYTWHWITSQNTSFRLMVRYAKKYDEFDIMMDK